ncbi:MAG: DUF2652 domain-containing protein [Chlamydiota bacterium]
MPEEMFLFIADISGYTAYMVRSEREHTHGTLVISELIKVLARQASLPMEVSKLEGDAVFFYLPLAKLTPEMAGNPLHLTKQLLCFFQTFSMKVRELQQSAACDCGACTHIDKLELKIVAHLGKATPETIGSFHELSGVDVILVHRLLKNQVKEKRYLMLTQAAHQRLKLPQEGRVTERVEIDKDIGEIPVVVYFPQDQGESIPRKDLSFTEKLKSHFHLATGTLLLKLGIIKRPRFHNFPE